MFQPQWEDKVLQKFQKPTSPEDALVSTIIRPSQTSANALIPLIRPLINSQGHIAVYSPSNSLILTDRNANIKRIRQVSRRIR